MQVHFARVRRFGCLTKLHYSDDHPSLFNKNSYEIINFKDMFFVDFSFCMLYDFNNVK